MARKSKRKRERQAKKRADHQTQQITNDVSDTASVNGREAVASSDSSNGQSDGKIFVPDPPQTFDPDDWSGPDGEIGKFISGETANVLNAYEADPVRLDEDAAGERFTSRGGYANRQLVELVQNSADALTGVRGRISIILTDKYLYCADNGNPIIPEGVNSLMRSHLSTKSGTNVIGRFGLGFKAVLAVTDSPEFFSRSGSFVFNRARSEMRIRERVPDAPRCPVLRLPEAIDPVAHSDGDANLRGLMSWATNIVRLPLKSDYDDRLSDQIRDFKPQCLFFMQDVERLTLADYAAGEKQQDFTIRQIDGDEWRLNDGESSSRWKLFTREHELSTKAQDDYQTELEDGDKVRISWAVPLERIRVLERAGASGYFWAFFPTESSSLVSGILNTHWKTNEDRQNLLPGDYNNELIQEAANLITESLHKLWNKTDPSKHLDVLPKRRESGDNPYADKLRDAVFRLLYGEQVIPDQSGELQGFDEIQYPPSEVTENRALDKVAQRWKSFDDRPVGWVHRSTYTPASRWAIVDRLCDPNGTPPNQGGDGAPRSSFAEWLEALVEGKSGADAVEASKVAIQTAALIPEDIRRREALGKIVLTQDSSWVSIGSDKVFLPGGVDVDESEVAEFTLVHPDLSSDEETVVALKKLGIREVSAEIQFRELCKKARRWNDSDWDENGETFWELSRLVDQNRVTDIAWNELDSGRSSSHCDLFLKVQTLSGNWQPFDAVLLPGSIVPDDGSRDADVAVDMKFHANDMEMLEFLVQEREPVKTYLGFDSSLFAYSNSCKSEYQRWCEIYIGQRPRTDKLVIYRDIESELWEGTGPLNVLRHLSDEGRARYTDIALGLDETYQKWEMVYETRARNTKYPVKEFESPAVWMLKRHGMVRTSNGIVALSDVIRSPGKHVEVLQWVNQHEKASRIREAFGFPDKYGILKYLSTEDTAKQTGELLSLDKTYIDGRESWSSFSSWRGSKPLTSIRNHGLVATPQRVVRLRDVIESPSEYPDALLWVDEHPKADKIRKAFELPKPLSEEDYLKPVGEADPIPLIDEWPGLEKHLSSKQKDIRLVRCEEIVTNAGFPADRGCFARGIDVYLTNLDDDGMSELNAVLDALQLGLNENQIEEILAIPTRAEILELREEVRLQDSDAERLLKAVGEEQLRKGLPPSLLDYMRSRTGGLSGIDVAEAAISTYHTGALKHYKHALAHLDPPAQMAGGDKAVTFVRSLGFSDEWAGDRNRKLDPFEEVMGPYSLPDLHDYQKKIVDKLRQMLSPGPLDPDSRRGMISLPTGSGKTRVAVQGLVDAMREDVLDGGILWVADRDELCEQAVESWRQVWANIGVEARQLRISRMWAGQPPPMPTNELHVVVATIQTLRAKLTSGNQDYDFVKKCNLVVFDEAHRSIAQSYTLALTEIGFTRRQGASEPFLLGLTATPYRGFNEDETRWLTNRYGSNRLDRGAFRSDNANEVIGELQDMTVLARADHETIEGGRFRLSWSEIQEAMRSPWLPSSVEIRLAKDPDRTERILDAYQEHIDGDWATLIFATSVEHAQTLSALLNSRGVKARAVSGSTDRTTRRRVVEEFRNGDIKVLVNYGVFREGFDAPKTRAIIVARPVYSPNLYFQMIGRGLRGVKNGGNDRCLILNVQDNIENFERKLAFTELDWLWDGG